MPSGSAGFVDHFPSTHETWIGDQLRVLEAGSDVEAHEAASQLRTHIMARYRTPLLAYATASSFRSLSSPEDLVHGFFAERLTDLTYLQSWRDSRMKLRRWLCNGLLLHMFDVAQRRRRDARAENLAGQRAQQQQRVDEPAADLAFERAWARGVIERAAEATETALRADGRDDAWRLFTRHVVDGLTQVAAGAEVGLAEGETKARLRLVLRRLRDAVAAELVADGVPLAQVQAETDAIVSVFGQGA